MGGQEEEMEACGNHEVVTGMPPGLVAYQYHLLALSSTDLPGEVRQDDTEDIRAHGGPELPLGLSGERLDKGSEIHPLVAMMDRGNGALSPARPHPAQDGLQTNAVFVPRPEFHNVLRMGLLDLSQFAGEFFV